MLPAVFEILDPTQRWVVSREPAISVAFSLVEVAGILAGRNDSGYLNFFNPALPRFSGSGATYHGAYGFRLRHAFDLDQILRACQVLSRRPESRQVVLQTWDARTDLPFESGLPRAEDIPCNICSLLKVRDGALHWTQIMRSNDLFLGTPYNFVQFTMLQEVIAGWIGVRTGRYTHLSDSLHLYEESMARAFEYSAEIVPEVNNDSFLECRGGTEPSWRELNSRIDQLTRSGISAASLNDLAESDFPQPQRNMLSIIAADAARRHRYPGLADQIASACTNPSLRQLWKRWHSRKKRERQEAQTISLP
jgi:thymidylate synthase